MTSSLLSLLASILAILLVGGCTKKPPIAHSAEPEGYRIAAYFKKPGAGRSGR